MEDKRNGPRHRVMKPGTIGFNGSGIECLVCNVSQSGAAIEIKGTIYIPDGANSGHSREVVHGLAIGVVCPDHDDASNPKTLFIGANRPASLDQFVAPALSKVIRRLAPWE